MTLLLVLFTLCQAAPPAPIYSQNFEKLAEGPPPDEFLILNGNFNIKTLDGNKVVELAGDPLDTNGILLGPADKNTGTLSARIQTTSSGKRSNEFGLGACGPGQYKLWLMPATGELQLIKGEDVKASLKYDWTSGTWTRFKLQVANVGEGKFKVQGKAWADGKDEPKEWMLAFEESEPPQVGRACLLCTPYASTPTRFDDVVIEP